MCERSEFKQQNHQFKKNASEEGQSDVRREIRGFPASRPARNRRYGYMLPNAIKYLRLLHYVKLSLNNVNRMRIPYKKMAIALVPRALL